MIRCINNMTNKINTNALQLENESLRQELHSINQTKKNILIYNQQFEKAFGVKSENLESLLPADFFNLELANPTKSHDLSFLHSWKAELRQRTDTRLQDKIKKTNQLSATNKNALLQEFQVQQINLEVQNEELRDARDEAEVLALSRYTELFNFAPIGYLVLNSNSRITQANKHGASLLGLKELDSNVKFFVNYVALQYRIAFRNFLAEAFETNIRQHCEISILIGKQSMWLNLEANIGEVATDCFVAIIDITERKKALLWKNARTRVLELIANDETLPTILESIVLGIEQEHPDMLCSILLLDDSGKYLLIGAGPSLPTFYNDAINGIKVEMGAGSCGTAAFSNERVIVEDVHTHPYWSAYTDLASEAKLGACWSEPIRDTNGQVLGTFAVYHKKIYSPTESDFTVLEQMADLASIVIEKKKRDLILKSSENRLRFVLAATKQAWFDLNLQSGEVLTSPEYSKILGYDSAKFHSDLHGWQDSLHPDDHDEVMASYFKCLSQGGKFSAEYRRSKKGGTWLWFNTTGEITEWSPSQKPLRMIGIHTDITNRKQTEEQLEHIAHYDLLTGLPNRVYLANLLKNSMEWCQNHNQSLAVAFIDLDSFKVINDNQGHTAGDKLLITLSQRMKEALREGDTLARIGGDEFIVVMVGIDSIESGKPVLERLLKAASDPVTLNRTVVRVSASIGVTLFPKDGVEPDQLMRHADQAMYIAKLAGKNRYHLFDTERNNAITIQSAEIDDIRLALKRNDFLLHYQPQVNMKTGEVVGVEALIRWQNSDRGLILPLDFLPAIEGHPISLEMGERVIDIALSQIKQWLGMGLSLPISVNVSAYQLQQNDFSTRLAELLTAHPEVSPHLLELEILETGVLSDIDQVSVTMNACHKLGVCFALDDFGTGYSSLTHIRRLPAYLIKIDQSFVRDMLEDTDDLAIVDGVVKLAKAFQRKVMAEGVETMAHRDALLELGCQLAQGYGIARPMPPADIPQWISNWNETVSWQKPSLICP